MFIVFDGIDGCGKTTQIFRLSEHLSSLSKYAHILITREAYKDRKIREVLRQIESKDKFETLTKLFVEDRKEHIKELILPSLKKDVIVISARYKYSTIAFQAAEGKDMRELVRLHENMPVPDFTFIMDVPSEIAFNRIHKRDTRVKIPGSNKFEEDISFLEKVRKNYLKMPEIFPNEKIIIMDGSKSVEEIFDEIKKYFPKV